MIDPISMVAVVAGVTETTQRMFNNARKPDNAPKHLVKIMSEVEILLAIFLDATTMLDSLTTATPASADIALRQCFDIVRNLALSTGEYFLKVGNDLPKAKATARLARPLRWSLRDSDKIKEEVATFRTAVTLLREIANDAMTHDLIRSQLYFSSVAPKSHMKSAGSSGTASAADSDSEAGDTTNPYQDTWGERFAIRGGDIYLQYGTISLAVPNSKEALWQPVKIKFDTGSDFNLVSREVLDMMNFTGPFEEPKPVGATTVDGITHKMTDRVKLSWQLHKSLKTLRTRFYVVEDAPFDLLIGKSVTAGQDLPQHSRNFLLRLRMPRLSKEERERTDTKTKDREQEAEAAELAEQQARQQAHAPSVTPIPARPTVPVSTTASSNTASRTSLGP